MKRRVITSILAATAIVVPLTAGTSASPAKASTSPFQTVWSSNFSSGASVPKGSFSNCSDTTLECSAATTSHGLGAYPAGWPDTAEQEKQAGQTVPGNVGGYYEPQDTLWLGGGNLVINEYHEPNTATNYVAAVVPLASINVKYGEFTERLEVTSAPTGYKSAHLLWPDNSAPQDGTEIDFPEGDWDDANGQAYNYDHAPTADNLGQLSFDSNVNWNTWHTYQIQWTPTGITTLVDGNVIGTSTSASYIPQNAMDWIVQNETSLDGEVSVAGPHSQMVISSMSYAKYVG
jgi:hypothetical protein